MKTEQKILTIFILSIALIMTVASFKYGQGARTLPFYSGVITVILLAGLLLISFSPGLAAWYQKVEESAEPQEAEKNREERKRELSVIGLLIGCMACIYILGFQVGTPLFLFVFLKIWEKESWLLSITLSVAVTVVVCFGFNYLLGVPLHTGIFW
jgi:uncharacterized membrane protein